MLLSTRWPKCTDPDNEDDDNDNDDDNDDDDEHNVRIPVFVTWEEVSSELTGEKLSSSAFDVDGRIGPDERKAGLVWSDLVSICVDTNAENLSVSVIGLLVVAPNEWDGDGEAVVARI